mmetsp:Transcript_15999/g.53615  ORF Transcript_15999/g.53615 Transcript_15999/m.53615 type:complete len:181 (-) Transcript_15999:96-638(-)
MVFRLPQKRTMDVNNFIKNRKSGEYFEDSNALVATLAFECSSSHRTVSREGARTSREDPVYFSHEKNVRMVKKIPKAKCVVLPHVLPASGPIAWPAAPSVNDSPTASRRETAFSPDRKPTPETRPKQLEPSPSSSPSRDGNINPQHVSINLKTERSPGPEEALFEIERCPPSPRRTEGNP